MMWRLVSSSLDCSTPRIVGILNATPDSFSAVGRNLSPEALCEHASALVREGAAMLDLGGVSTRPGAAVVATGEELARVLPVLRALRGERALDATPISIDTTSSEVARACIDAGADAINDVSAGTHDPAMLGVVACAGCGLVLMHRVLPPQHDRYSDRMEGALLARDGVEEVAASLSATLRRAKDAGVREESIVLDPGLGFGKTVEQNMALIRRTDRIAAIGRPLMSALSRKSFVGRVGLDRDSTPDERLPATLTLSIEHLRAGARLFRVHDVGPHAQALRAAWACWFV